MSDVLVVERRPIRPESTAVIEYTLVVVQYKYRYSRKFFFKPFVCTFLHYHNKKKIKHFFFTLQNIVFDVCNRQIVYKCKFEITMTLTMYLSIVCLNYRVRTGVLARQKYSHATNMVVDGIGCLYLSRTV